MCWFLAAATRRCARRSLRARLAAACCCSSARRGIFLIRGTPYNTGRVLRMLMDAGAKTIGDPTQGHSVAIDARAPKFDGGICTRVDCVSLGVVVNRNAERFYDEGEDFWPKRYAIWGRLVAGQPGQIGYSIIDAKAVGRFMPPVFPGTVAGSLPELA